MSILLFAGGLCSPHAQASAAVHPENSDLENSATVRESAPPTDAPRRFIREYRVLGGHRLKRTEIEEAVYPYLGPSRTVEDVEHARAALEKAYQAKGYQSVSVQIPPQRAAHGIVFLKVAENTVGRLRVRDSRYFSLHKIQEH